MSLPPKYAIKEKRALLFLFRTMLPEWRNDGHVLECIKCLLTERTESVNPWAIITSHLKYKIYWKEYISKRSRDSSVGTWYPYSALPESYRILSMLSVESNLEHPIWWLWISVVKGIRGYHGRGWLGRWAAKELIRMFLFHNNTHTWGCWWRSWWSKNALELFGSPIRIEKQITLSFNS